MFRLLLMVFPKAFRDRFGRDMAEVFADRLRIARARGTVAAALLWIRTMADMVAHGLSERRSVGLGRANRGVVMMQSMVQDIRYALRAFRRRPGFSAVVLATLMLGIGANTAIFSVVEAVLLRPLPYPDADRVVQVYETNRRYSFARGVVSPFNFDVWEREARSFEHLAATRSLSMTLTGTGEPARVRVLRVTPNFFSVLALPPAQGRTLSVADAESGEPVAVLSHDLWVSRFERDPAVLGRTVTLDDRAMTIVGVMPPEFSLTASADIYLPYVVTQSSRQAIGSYYLGVIAKLAPGVPIARAQDEMDTIAGRLEVAYPTHRADRGVALVDLRDDRTGRVAGGLKLLQGIALLVLLIACANVANLGIAGASARQREMAIRASIGASRRRLTRQLLTEHLVLSLAGAGLGLVLATWSVRVLIALAPARTLPEATTVGLNGAVLAFTFAVALVTGLVTGLMPAWLGSRTSVVGALKNTGHGVGGGGQRLLRASLVTAEVGLAVVLVTGSFLLARSYARLASQDPGFSTERILTAHITLPAARYETENAQRAFWSDLVDRLRALPGVTDASASTALPFSNWEWQTWFEVEDRPAASDDGSSFRVVTPGYFAAMGIPMRLGREFTAEDRAQAEPVAIVNEAFARAYLSDSPVGQRIRTERPAASAESPASDAATGRWMTIIGVAGSTRHARLDRDPNPELYRPVHQSPSPSMILGLRTEGDPAALAPLVRDAVRQVDRRLPIESVRSMEEAIGATTARPRFDASLVGLFAGLAAALAVAGIVGVMTFVVGQRTREVGIRLALGGTPAGVQALIVCQGLIPVVVGIAIGAAATVAIGRRLATDLFAIESTDPGTLVMAATAFFTLALLAAWAPARRAGKADPVSVLRAE